MATNKAYKYPDEELFNYVKKELDKRNINEQTVGEAAYELQHEYLPELTVQDFGAELKNILAKREVLNILAMGFTIDNIAQKKELPAPLQDIMENDAGVWQLDEMFAVSIAQLYGMLSVTNFGFADKTKVGWAKRLDNSPEHITVFADDLFLALVSAVIGRCGHGSKLNISKKKPDKEQNYHISGHLDSRVRNALYSYHEFDGYLCKRFENSVLADDLEEVINHDYYVATVIIMKNNVHNLRLDFANNALEHQFSVFIPIKDLYDYCLSYAGGGTDEMFKDDCWLAELIDSYMFEHDLYQGPEEEQPTEETNNSPESNLVDVDLDDLIKIYDKLSQFFNNDMKEGTSHE